MIESHRIEYKLTLTDNFEKKDIELVEHLGSGLNRILKVYKKDSFFIKDNYMKNIFYSNNKKLKLDDPISDPINDPINQIIELLVKDNKLSYDHLSFKLNMSNTTIKRHIQKLKTLELIKRVGSKKTGHWEIINKKGNKK